LDGLDFDDLFFGVGASELEGVSRQEDSFVSESELSEVEYAIRPRMLPRLSTELSSSS
jgi:hypothetical protein